MKNAKFYERAGCCWVLDQNDLNKEKLLKVLSNIKNGIVKEKIPENMIFQAKCLDEKIYKKVYEIMKIEKIYFKCF